MNLLRGKRILNKLKITSVMASCASAWTLEFLISRHQNQQMSLTMTVLAMTAMEGRDRSTTERSEEMRRVKDVSATWTKDVTITTAKTNTLSGSSRRRLIGYRERSCRRIRVVVIQTMAVLRKSNAPSTKLARTDREFVMVIAIIFATRRRTLAMKLTYIATVTIRSLLSTNSSFVGMMSGGDATRSSIIGGRSGDVSFSLGMR